MTAEVGFEQQASLSELEAFARGMYARTHALWQQHRQHLVTGECGFALLSGPPQFRPKLLILGTNFGYGAGDVGKPPREETSWPGESWLPNAAWPLARKLRALFVDAGLVELHDAALMTNFLFLKSSSIDREEPMAWTNNDPVLRQQIERACLQEVSAFIKRSEPEVIVVIGTGPFRAHADLGTVQTALADRRDRRALISTGTIFGVPAIGLIHLTGNRIAGSDLGRMREWLHARLFTSRPEPLAR